MTHGRCHGDPLLTAAVSGRSFLRLFEPRRHFNAYRRWCLTGPLGTITHIATNSPVVALTFDDGPDPIWTPRLLEILAARDARATFFMLGRAAEAHPEIVRDVARAGHAIGNHSWDHPSFPLIGRAERWTQIRRCARVLGPHGARLFRPPFGQQNVASRIDAFALGYCVVAWNVVAWDWLERDADWMTRQLLDHIRAGSIVLLHDAIVGGGLEDEPHYHRDNMLTAVSNVLGALADTMTFVTVPELLTHGRAQRQPWLVQPSPQFAERLARQRAR